MLLLLELVLAHSTTSSAEVHLLAAAASDDVVRAVVERVTRRRIGFIASLLEQTGVSPAVAARRALLAYSVYRGHAQLAAAVPTILPAGERARQALVDEMVAVLAPRT